MKILKHLFTLIFLLSVSFFLHAEPVSVEKASKVAENFMMQKHTYLTEKGKSLKMIKSLELTNVATRSFDYNNFYIFNLNDDKGWVIVSGDDSVTPILGYSTNGSFNIDSIGPNTKELLDSYNAHIENAANVKSSANEDVARQWSELLSGKSNKYVNKRNDRKVNPLIQTQWSQSPYYNYYSPYDDYYDEQTVTGCVATAMAQIMNYWEYPAKGTGYHSYNHEEYGTLSANFGASYYEWDNMPAKLNSSSSSTQIKAVAKLMYDCGIAVEMDYGVAALGGSGAYVISWGEESLPCAENALKSYFDYKNTLQGVYIIDFLEECLDEGYSEDDFIEAWINMLKNELDNDRPILYSGYGETGGHAFVCDGYDNNDFFHFNWGWGGVADGYFHFLDLTPDEGIEGSNYTGDQQVIIGIEPKDMSQQGFELRLYSDLYMEDEIWFGSEVELDVDIANFGDATFEGYVCAAVFDEDGYFVDYIQIYQCELQAGYYSELTFYDEGSYALVPGLYQVMLLYGTELGDWIAIDDGEYYNYTSFEVVYSADIEVYSDFTILSDNGELLNGNVASINVDVLNTDYNTFNGNVRLILLNLDGSLAQTIQEIKIELQHNYHFTNGLTFEGVITAEPGSYHLSLDYKRDGTNSWYYAGASDYPNPVKVIVKAADISPDSYENNNTQNTAYNFNINWSNDHASVNTVDANLHVGNDLDYYKIVLPKGYNYEISPRLYDEYTDEDDYSADVIFSYSINGDDYSETFDDVVDENITLNDGGTIYFVVAPYYQGMTGTYKFKVDINRNLGESLQELSSLFEIYPNPVENELFLATELRVEEIAIYDIYGHQTTVYGLQTTDFVHSVNVAGLEAGVYFVKVVTNEGEIVKRFVKQ